MIQLKSFRCTKETFVWISVKYNFCTLKHSGITTSIECFQQTNPHIALMESEHSTMPSKLWKMNQQRRSQKIRSNSTKKSYSFPTNSSFKRRIYKIVSTTITFSLAKPKNSTDYSQNNK